MDSVGYAGGKGANPDHRQPRTGSQRTPTTPEMANRVVSRNLGKEPGLKVGLRVVVNGSDDGLPGSYPRLVIFDQVEAVLFDNPH